MVTIRRLAEILGTDIRRIHYLISSGRIPRPAKYGQTFLFDDDQPARVAKWYEDWQELDKGLTTCRDTARADGDEPVPA